MKYQILPDRSDWPEFPLRQSCTLPYAGQGYGDKAQFKIEAGLHYLTGNPRPYFYVTGTMFIPGWRDCEACGCLHEDAVKAWPSVAPVVTLHLSDDRGLPMHLEANGLYHLGFGPYSKLDLKVAANHFRVGEVEAAALRADIVSGSGYDSDKYQYWLAQQKPRYHREAEAAIEWLESVTV